MEFYQEEAIQDVLWDYYVSLRDGYGKENIYMDNLAKAFPEIAKKAKKATVKKPNKKKLVLRD